MVWILGVYLLHKKLLNLYIGLGDERIIGLVVR